MLFAGYSIPQVADRWLAGLELSVFQKVTQKVWFVVLVGLLLGLACGAVMAWWPGLRGVAAGVAVVGALLLGRVDGAGGWLSLPVAAGVSAIGASLFVSRRWGFPVALVVAAASLVVGGIWGLWGVVKRRGARLDRNASVCRTGTNCGKCSAACDAESQRIRYQRLPTDEDTRIERLAVLLHDAGRSAVEQGLTQNPSGAFVEWDDAPERTRAGRRSQAQYLLAAGVVLPTSPADAEQIKRDCAQAAEKLKSDPKLADNAKAHLDIAANALADTLIRREALRKSPFYVADDEREVTLIAQRPKFSKAYFLARIGADACYRLPDGKLDVKTANRALYDAFKPLVEGELLPPVEHTPAPAPTTQIAPAADREAAAKEIATTLQQVGEYLGLSRTATAMLILQRAAEVREILRDRHVKPARFLQECAFVDCKALALWGIFDTNELRPDAGFTQACQTHLADLIGSIPPTAADGPWHVVSLHTPTAAQPAQAEKGRESYAEPRIVKGGGGDYFVAIRGGLWRIEADGSVGCDAESRAGFCELLAELVSANQTKIALAAADREAAAK